MNFETQVLPRVPSSNKSEFDLEISPFTFFRVNVVLMSRWQHPKLMICREGEGQELNKTKVGISCGVLSTSSTYQNSGGQPYNRMQQDSLQSQKI